MLRLLVEDITVTKGQVPKLLRLHIRWQGGAIETIELRRSSNRAEAVRYPDAFVAHIRALAATHDDDEIVALLNRDDLKSSIGRRFTVAMIRWIRHKHQIPSPLLSEYRHSASSCGTSRASFSSATWCPPQLLRSTLRRSRSLATMML